MKTELRLKFENNLQKILDLYWNKNMNAESIADIVGIKARTLRKYMSDMHLLRRPGQNSIKYTVDENFFETIDTEKKAYWLGVLYADGCVMHIRNTKYIVFSAVDKEWLEQYKKDISFTGPVLKEHHKKYNKDIYKVKCTSKKMYSDLENKGVVERKSNILEFPVNSVPDSLMPHFIRGYFDGDGSVGVYQNVRDKDWRRLRVSITSGSLSFIEAMRTWMIEHKIFPIGKPVKRNNRDVYALNLSLIAGLRLRDCMYKDATAYLQRKYDKFYSVDYCKRTFNDYNRASRNGMKE